jgi:prepilin-type N-terminal cleavage/methylation domain-containing protein
MRAHRRRGMSLVEMLVACGIFGILTLMIAQIVAPAISMTLEGTVRVQLQEQGMLAVQALVNGLQSSVPTGVSLVNPNSNTTLAVNPLSGVDANGYPAYQQSLQLFWVKTAAGELWQKSYPSPTEVSPFTMLTTTPTTVSAGQLTTIIGTTNGSEKRLVEQLQSFNVEQESTTGGVVFAIRMIMIEVVPSSGKTVDVEFSRKLVLRNNGD